MGEQQRADAAATAVFEQARKFVAAVDGHIRYDMLAAGLVQLGWEINSMPADEGGLAADLWAFKGDASLHAPFSKPEKDVVVSHDADQDGVRAWAGRFDQETPLPALLAIAEMVAGGVYHRDAA